MPVPLFWAFLADYKNELAHLATCSPENPKLETLEQILREQFGGSDDLPRGIIFTQTRQSVHSLLLWLQQQPGLKTMDIRADVLIGAGNSSQNTHMTQVWALRRGAGTGGVLRGEGWGRVFTELWRPGFPRQKAENRGRGVHSEIPGTEGFPSLGIPGHREADAWGICREGGKCCLQDRGSEVWSPLLEKNRSCYLLP